MRANDRPVRLPEVPAAYLVEWWQSLGLAGAEGGPLEWREIAAWQRFHAPLEPWEARALRRMSEAYAAENAAGRDPEREAPFGVAEQQAEIDDRVTRQFAAMRRAILAAKGQA